MQALGEILVKIPKEECIVQLFTIAEKKGHISSKTRLLKELDWLSRGCKDPLLHYPEADWPYPVQWQCSSEGVYIAIKIRAPWDNQARFQGFFYRLSESREKLASGTQACTENEAIFTIPNSNQINYVEVAKIFAALLDGKKYIIRHDFWDSSGIVDQDDWRKGFSFVTHVTHIGRL